MKKTVFVCVVLLLLGGFKFNFQTCTSPNIMGKILYQTFQKASIPPTASPTSPTSWTPAERGTLPQQILPAYKAQASFVLFISAAPPDVNDTIIH